MSLEYAVRSDIGKGRANNEDAYYVDVKNGLFVLADGLGGHAAGEVASRMAVETIARHIFRSQQRGLGPADELLREAVEIANRAVYHRAQKDPSLQGMATTVVVAMVMGETLHLAHVGDSRAYLLGQNDRLIRLTEDHSLVTQMINEGKITQDEATVHPYRNVLLRCLGIDESVLVDVQNAPFPRGKLLLCSDGLTEMLNDNEVEEILKLNPDCQAACDVLVSKANDRGGIDNITVLLVKRDR